VKYLKKEMKEYIKSTPLAWISDHSIVSAVLWILGHDMTKQKNKSSEQEHKEYFWIEQYFHNSPNAGIYIKI
jgi:hypothetical protein